MERKRSILSVKVALQMDPLLRRTVLISNGEGMVKSCESEVTESLWQSLREKLLIASSGSHLWCFHKLGQVERSRHRTLTVLMIIWALKEHFFLMRYLTTHFPKHAKSNRQAECTKITHNERMRSYFARLLMRTMLLLGSHAPFNLQIAIPPSF